MESDEDLFSENEQQADLRNGGFLICILFLRVLRKIPASFVCSHVMLFTLFHLAVRVSAPGGRCLWRHCL